MIVGASSGIGRALARTLGNRGYEVALFARRTDLLESLGKEIPQKTYPAFMDVRDPADAARRFHSVVRQMGGLDLLILNAGVNHRNPDFCWDLDDDILKINVFGFTALADLGVEYFLKQGHGHLVGISSIAGLRGAPRAPVYSASKAFVSNYLEALYFKVAHRGIYVTDIRPGFVDTPMIAGRKYTFCVASPEKAARQIFEAIRRRKKVAYVTRRWAWLAYLYRSAPDWLLGPLNRRIKD